MPLRAFLLLGRAAFTRGRVSSASGRLNALAGIFAFGPADQEVDVGFGVADARLNALAGIFAFGRDDVVIAFSPNVRLES